MARVLEREDEGIPSPKRLNVDRTQIDYKDIPHNGVIPFSDMAAICQDFSVDEYIFSQADILVTDKMKEIYNFLKNDPPAFKLLLHGASGVGKTMTLLFMGHMARKNGCIVFPIQCKDFVNQNIPLCDIVWNFLDIWSRALGKEFLSKFPCRKAKFPNLFDLVSDGLSNTKNIFTCFSSLVHELKNLITVPVVFLIDQCNAFFAKHTVQIFADELPQTVEPGKSGNPIGNLFVNWNHFRMSRGCILYAFSSSFNLMPTASDGGSNIFQSLQPLDLIKFKKLLEMFVRVRNLPQEWLVSEYFIQIFNLCSGIPRELLAFSLTLSQASENADFDILKIIYMENRCEFYLDRIKRLLSKENLGEKLFNSSVSFASRIFVGRPMESVPQIWKFAGLLTLKNGKYELLCKAAADALLKSIDENVMREAISIFSSDSNTKWRALELCFVYVFRYAIASGDPVYLDCTKLDGGLSKKLVLRVNNIVHFEGKPPASSLPQGTMLVCPRNTPVIDFFIHDINGQKIALQVSESSYIDHSSKYLDLKKIIGDYENALVDGNSSEVQYVYLTTSKHKMQKRGSHYNEKVLLISNINNGANLFFKNLIAE